MLGARVYRFASRTSSARRRSGLPRVTGTYDVAEAAGEPPRCNREISRDVVFRPDATSPADENLAAYLRPLNELRARAPTLQKFTLATRLRFAHYRVVLFQAFF